MSEKLTDEEKAALRRVMTALKTWWLTPLGVDAAAADEVIEAVQDAHEKGVP